MYKQDLRYLEQTTNLMKNVRKNADICKILNELEPNNLIGRYGEKIRESTSLIVTYPIEYLSTFLMNLTVYDCPYPDILILN